MQPRACLYIRNDGSFGASCDGCLDTGHFIAEDSGRFTVYSIADMREDVMICENANRYDAEIAIAADWRAAK